MRITLNPCAIFLLTITSVLTFSIRESKSSFLIGSRIIGGQTATVAQFPYQVGVQAKVDGVDPLLWSGGSLISKNYVLTAAHSVQIRKILYIEVHLGVLELKNDDEPRKIITVYENNFIVHEGYTPGPETHDIALLRLPEDVEFNDKIQPITLPTRADADIDMEGKYIVATGWGRISDAHYNASTTLLYAEMRVLNQRICKHFYSNLLPSMICTSSDLGKATCNGDSGGPLVYTNPDSKRNFLVGITSFGYYTCAEDGWPGVHTRVTSYLDWIEKHTGIQIQN